MGLFIKVFFIFIERGREREKEGDKHQCVVESHMAPTGDLDDNPDMCPDWELNRDPLVSNPRLIQWATPARTSFLLFYNWILKMFFLLMKFIQHIKISFIVRFSSYLFTCLCQKAFFHEYFSTFSISYFLFRYNSVNIGSLFFVFHIYHILYNKLLLLTFLFVLCDFYKHIHLSLGGGVIWDKRYGVFGKDIL